jgi:hypothetical protein
MIISLYIGFEINVSLVDIWNHMKEYKFACC